MTLKPFPSEGYLNPKDALKEIEAMTERHAQLPANNRLRIFIASPSDVAEERDIVSNVVGELRRMFEKNLPYSLDAVRWETHAWPDIGKDAQDVINRQIGEYDILVGIMWRRFGTPTKRSDSGTYEEFKRGYEFFCKLERPKIMFYFRTTPFYSKNLLEITQFRKIISFRKELEKKGVLFWEYETSLQFERNVREHLIQQIFAIADKSKADLQGRIFLESAQDNSDSIGFKYYQPVKPSTKIFLAYTHQDIEAVMKTYEALRVFGFDPWLDRENLLPGQMWRNEIEKAIVKAEVILIFISRNSFIKGGFFKREIYASLKVAQRQSSKAVSLITVRLEKVELPENLSLYRCVDYYMPDGIERLISVLKSLPVSNSPQKNPSDKK